MTFFRIVLPPYPFCLSMIFFEKTGIPFSGSRFSLSFLTRYFFTRSSAPLRWKTLWVARIERISPISVVMVDYRSEIALRNVRDSASTEYGF
jgi:hypothetical protein